MRTKQAPPTDLMNVLADSKRQIQLLEKYNREQQWIKGLTQAIKLYSGAGVDVEPLLIQEKIVARSQGILDLDWLNVLAQAMKRIYGDPAKMIDTRQHSTPWWNPTPNRVNIKPMGLWAGETDKEGNRIQVDFIDPGEVMLLPIAYTSGGKQSVVKGVAPQLRPLDSGVDDTLDLQPQTYSEWCYFIKGGELSKCHKAQTVWSNRLNHVVCMKCGKECQI